MSNRKPPTPGTTLQWGLRHRRCRWRPERGPFSRPEVVQVGGCGVDQPWNCRRASVPQCRVWAIACRRALEFSG